MKQQIAVYLPDNAYGERFVKYLKQIPQSTYEICYFSDAETCIKFLKDQKVKVLILKEWEKLDKVLNQAEQVILLSEQSQQTKEEVLPSKVHEFKVFYQYQSMEQLIPLIWPRQAESIPQKVSDQFSNQQLSILSIITMESMEHAFSLVYAVAECEKQRGKTLLIDCTPFSSVREMAAKEQEEMGFGLSDVIYYLREENGFTAERVKKLIHSKRGVDTIYPVNHCLDLYELKCEHIAAFLEAVKEAGYQRIVIAVSVFTEAVIEFLKLSRTILYACAKEESSSVRSKVVSQLGQVLPKACMTGYQEFELREEKEMISVLQKSIFSGVEAK